MTPLVSILIPAYNAEKWLAETINSALQQTWPNKEIIVVDDGSKDGTLAVAKSFASQGVVAITQENQGASAARNKAFSVCHGEYIQWLDADDLIAPNKIARQLQNGEPSLSRGILLSSEWGYFLHEPARAQFIPTALWCDLSPAEWMIRKLEQNLHMQPATWLVSREMTQTVGPWDTTLSLDDDGEYFGRVLRASDNVRFIAGARTFYRRTGSGSLSRISKSSAKLRSQFRSMELQVAYLRSLEDSPRARAACLTYLQRSLIYFYPEMGEIVARAQALAADLGSRLDLPRLPWKYSWIQKILGWQVAKAAWLSLPEYKASVSRAWERLLFVWTKRSKGKA